MNQFERDIFILLCKASPAFAAHAVEGELARQADELEAAEYRHDELRKQFKSLMLDCDGTCAELEKSRARVAELEHLLRGAVYIVPCSDGDDIEFDDVPF